MDFNETGFVSYENLAFEAPDSKADAGFLAPSGDPDTDPPVVVIVSPPSPSLRRSEYVIAEVTDAGIGLRKVILMAEFSDGTYDVIHDGVQFASRYATLSTRSSITNGFRYQLLRTGGWPTSFTLRAIAFDQAGNDG